ncbi:DUF6447 family protein [Oceanospirillum sediminis]|uniref:Uncharacterized protein n=1 Tax=Oceanospirillum sediminis TaxID=2760088 RepID=A0A839IK84_9GAMM|nr:DUF6447 family protein [Oceanospirillum sediminis]MBB1485311.1 hypothetical protein [Oceanospirillum sediminis]
MSKINIDGKDYDLNTLPEEAQKQILSLQVCDQKIRNTEQELAILQTARNAYALALKGQLPE